MYTDNTELFQSVKDYLFSRAHAPGKKVDTETSLAARFGVSRYRIRQVMSTLAQMGFIQRSPRRGTVVSNLDADSLSSKIQLQMEVAAFDVEEYSQARLIIECSIMPLVVRNATPELLEQLDAILGKMAACEDDFDKADEHDRDFHLLLLQSCGNRVLQVFSNVLVTLFENTHYGNRFRDANYVLATVVREHARIVEAIRSGSAELASRRMREHLLEQSGRDRPRALPLRRAKRPKRTIVPLRRPGKFKA